MGQPFQIAIDGPVAAGKSSLARLLAKRLSLTYVDTGAMYRCLALAAQRQHLGWTDERGLGELARQLPVTMVQPSGDTDDGRTVTVLLDGEDVSWQIRNSEIGEGASQVGQYKAVREAMVAKQQALAGGQDVVMEGRDIGLVVLPNAQLKIYLNADLKARANRKFLALENKGSEQSLTEVQAAIEKRDNREFTRSVTPLKPAADAWQLDTTDFTLEQVADMICERIDSLGLRQ